MSPSRSILLLLLLALLFAAAAAAACSDARATPYRGNGVIKTEERSVAAFTGISLGGAATLHVHRGDKRLVRITTDENLLSHVHVEVEGGELQLGFDEDCSIRGVTKLEIDVTTPALDALELSGAVKATVDRFAGDRLRIENSGAVKLDAALDYKTLDLDLSGGGEIALKGTAGEVHIDGSGATRIAAAGLAAKSMQAEFSGAAQADLRASENLDIDVSGAGHVRYFGNPKLTKDVSGVATIERAGD